MRSWTLALLVVLVVLTVTISVGCGYHRRGGIVQVQVPNKMKTIILNSYDPYGLLTRAVRAELLLNNVIIVNDANNNHNTLPLLRILHSSTRKITSSVFQDGKTAEYKMILRLCAQVLMPDQNYYPIDVMVSSSFFDNPLTALAKHAEEDLLHTEMRQQAAQQLVRKFLALHVVAETTENALNTELQQPQPASP